MDDLRRFAPNRYCTLPVPALRRGGLRIALEGNQPARLAVAVSDIPAHREFLSGPARFLPPNDDVTLAERLRQFLQCGPQQVRRAPFADLTIEAGAARFLPRLLGLLKGLA